MESIRRILRLWLGRIKRWLRLLFNVPTKVKLSERQVDLCRGEGFIPLPKRIKEDRDYAYFVCPFCEKRDHTAMVRLGADLPNARPIFCPFAMRHAWVMFITEPLEAEETKFCDLLGKWADHPPMSAKNAVKAWHSQGCPLEIAEELATDKATFAELVAAHKAKGNVKAKAVY